MIASFNISLQGKSHASLSTPCQDYSYTEKTYSCNDKEYIIAGIGDGVGSCAFSHFGSQVAVTKAVEYASEHIRQMHVLMEKDILGIIKDSFGFALSEVLYTSEAEENCFILYDTTLSLSIYDGSNLFYGHIGDDGIVAVDHNFNYQLITKRHKGEEYSSVYPLRNTSIWEFGVKRNICSYAMMTDGVLDFCVDYDTNIIFEDFLKCFLLSKANDDASINELKAEATDLFKGNTKYGFDLTKAITDDITLSCIWNTDTPIL